MLFYYFPIDTGLLHAIHLYAYVWYVRTYGMINKLYANERMPVIIVRQSTEYKFLQEKLLRKSSVEIDREF